MWISINGDVRTPDQAQISLFDRGFLFGDAIYEVLRTWERRPFRLEAHLERLERSGAAIDLDVPAWRPEIERQLAAGIEAVPEGEVYLRVILTRGESPDLDLLETRGDPLRIVLAKPLQLPSPEAYARGLSLLAVHPDEVVGRKAPGVKSNNRQANVIAHRLAREAGYDDGLFVHPSGHVTEGPTWNLFVVRGGVLCTPPLDGGVLAGITRASILRLCDELGIETREGPLTLEEALGAEEVFVTSTTRGVMAVSRVNETRFEDVPGPLTRRLAAGYAELDAR